MKRYKYSFNESIHDYEIIEGGDGEWCKWKDVNDFVTYIIGIFKGMGLKKSEIKHILDEYKTMIDYLEVEK